MTVSPYPTYDASGVWQSPSPYTDIRSTQHMHEEKRNPNVMIASCSRHFYSNSTFKIDNDAEMYGDTVAAEYGPEAATYAPEAAKYAPEAAQYASLKSPAETLFHNNVTPDFLLHAEQYCSQFNLEEETTDGGIEIKHIAAPDQINPADTDEIPNHCNNSIALQHTLQGTKPLKSDDAADGRKNDVSVAEDHDKKCTEDLANADNKVEKEVKKPAKKKTPPVRPVREHTCMWCWKKFDDPDVDSFLQHLITHNSRQKTNFKKEKNVTS